MTTLVPVRLADLEVHDEDAFLHVGVFRALRRWLERSTHEFLVPREGELPFARALVLNLAFFDPASPRDVLVDRSLTADVLAHVAWHAIAAERLWPTVEGRFLGEAIASAFDLYAVGRLLGRAGESEFLATQVPALADAADAAGLDADAFEALLASVASDPDGSFEELRALLFDVLVALHRAEGPDEAAAVFVRFEDSRFAPILHHYEIASWILSAKGAGAVDSSVLDEARDPVRVDAALRAATSSVDWLEEHWVRPGAPDSD
jgi:hypothetical protein